MNPVKLQAALDQAWSMLEAIDGADCAISEISGFLLGGGRVLTDDMAGVVKSCLQLVSFEIVAREMRRKES